MFSILLITTLIAAQPMSLPSRLALVTAAERLPVLGMGKGALEVVVEPLAQRVELRGIANAKVAAQKMAISAGQLCPDVRGIDNAIVFQCRTRHLEAHLLVDHGKTYLEIEQVRGLPWRSPSITVPIFYEPSAFGMGDDCPGSTFAGRGECDLRDGRERDAVKHFQRAIEAGQMASLAGLRLGDIALNNDDVATALAWYKQASNGDTFGRVAAARLCELEGSCLKGGFAKLFKPMERPEPIRTELLLRAARAATFSDEYGTAVTLIAQAMERPETGACATVGQGLCRRVILACLENTKGEDAAQAIETYLALPGRQGGPLSQLMTRAAAERAAAIGAPLFAGNLMAANAADVDAASYPEHLLRTAEFFLDAGDVTRAGIVVDYAETRISRVVLGTPRWMSARGRARGVEGVGARSALSAFETLATEGARDLAAAYGALSRARTVNR